MTDAQGQLASQDTTQILQRIFTGHIVAQPAMGYAPIEAVVVSADNTAWEVVVTINGFDSPSGSPTPTLTCHYEPRWHWDGSANVKAAPPPAGTPCLVTFPTNTGDGLGWAIAFSGWPTE